MAEINGATTLEELAVMISEALEAAGIIAVNDSFASNALWIPADYHTKPLCDRQIGSLSALE